MTATPWVTLSVRVTPEQHAVLRAAAERMVPPLSVPAFVKTICLEIAQTSTGPSAP
jgi:hypothetical protein